MSWHDCHIRGLEFRVGAAEEDDWTSDLALEIDFIVEWICGAAGGAQFRVAPATLVFHGVTDLDIHADWGDSGFRVALQEASIDRIERVAVRDQKVYLDRPYYQWSIVLNWPKSGVISFGAYGFMQTLRGEPILTDQQRLRPSQRRGARQPRNNKRKRRLLRDSGDEPA